MRLRWSNSYEYLKKITRLNFRNLDSNTFPCQGAEGKVVCTRIHLLFNVTIALLRDSIALQNALFFLFEVSHPAHKHPHTSQYFCP